MKSRKNREGDIVDQIIESQKERLSFFNENYLLASIHLTDSDKKRYLGDIKNRKCRFPHKVQGKITFKKEAHAIPYFIGNKWLISNYECDECNEYFSRLENHLSEFLKVEKTIGLIQGREGIPTYRTNDKSSRIIFKNGEFLISSSISRPIVEFDKENKKLKLKIKRGGYIPRLSYKCLIKMALSIMPEDELGYFGKTLAWLMNEDINIEIETEMFQIWWGYTPGALLLPIVNIGLLRRKHQDNNTLPYMLYYMSFQNFFIQTFIPFSDMDKGESFQFPPYFSIPHDDPEFGRAFCKIINLSSKEKIKGEEFNLSVRYEKMTKILSSTIGDNNE